MANSPEQAGQTITNPVQSKAVLARNVDGLGVRQNISRPRDVGDPPPMILRPFLSGALSSGSVFGEDA
jgi:hypothetical protein